jgi:hypothetical protein
VGEEINLKDFLKFPFSFWLMSIICVSYYVAIFPFIGTRAGSLCVCAKDVEFGARACVGAGLWFA